MIYKTLNHQIDDKALTIKNADGTSLNVRPKTCQLLLLLVKNSGKPINKQIMLETVWVDSIVSEQVIFQSINEIRQLFSNCDVIKTIPKQGYLWLPSVVTNENSSSSKPAVKKAIFALCTLLVILGAYTIFKQQFDTVNNTFFAQQPVNGSIVILPTENQVAGNDLSWVRLGMMDQIIQRLPSTQNYGVLQTDYVLEVLKRSSSPLTNLTSEHIKQIFKVSGAELIVSSKLLGVPHDYQLSYVFHYRNRLKKGVLFNRIIQSLIDEFSLLIAAQLGKDTLPLDIAYQADFNNEILAAAIEKRFEGNYQQAEPLFESIVLSTPENITAQRLFVGTLQILNKFEQAFDRLNIALPIAYKLKDKGELTRLLYLKAINYYATYDDENAAKIAVQALAVAKENNDWLYMAHIKNIQANIAVNKNDYKLAEKLYIEAKQHHQVLRCPVGEAISWANLARLAKTQNQLEKFTTAINHAITIAKTRDLNSQLNYFIKIKDKNFNQLKQ